MKFFYKALLTFATDSAKCKYTEHYYYSFTPIAKTTTVSGTNEVSSTYKSEAVTQLKQLQLDHNTQLTATANKPYQRQRETVKQQTDKQSNTDRIDKLEKALVEIQMNNDSTQQQLSDVQKVNSHLQKQLSLNQQQLSDVQQQFTMTQQQLLDVQKTNSHLQNQLSINQQQLSDVQRKTGYLQNQLSLTQQQLLGVQSMMTCSRLWVVSHDQFTIGREIGRGAWATVHETKFRGATIAAKRLHHLITSPRTRELFSREMEMALHCQHQNIVTFLGATLEGPPVMLMELMSTSLRSAYEQGNIKDHQVLGILHDIARALHFLHTRPDPVIHRDVSSANVLLKALYNGEWVAKLGHLGTAKIQQQAATAGPGAIAYGAPEAADFTKHSPKMDVYSYGVLMLEVLTKTHPFQMVDALKAQVQQQFPQYHQLVTTCTSQQSRYRPTMYDVIEQLDRINTARP